MELGAKMLGKTAAKVTGKMAGKAARGQK